MIKTRLCLLTNQYCTAESCETKCNRKIPVNEPKKICKKSISGTCTNYEIINGVKYCIPYSTNDQKHKVSEISFRCDY